jgi:lipoprotein signal peptidase
VSLKTSKIFFLGIFLLILLSDQFLKYKVRQIGGFYICNMGISFGIQHAFLFLGIYLGYIILFLAIVKQIFLKNASHKPLFVLGCSLFLSGAFSNIVDRLFLGCVVDFLNPLKDLLPIFNLADIAIFFGALCLILIFYPRKVDNL